MVIKTQKLFTRCTTDAELILNVKLQYFLVSNAAEKYFGFQIFKKDLTSPIGNRSDCFSTNVESNIQSIVEAFVEL